MSDSPRPASAREAVVVVVEAANATEAAWLGVRHLMSTVNTRHATTRLANARVELEAALKALRAEAEEVHA